MSTFTKARAARLAYKRAVAFGYCHLTAQQFARVAARMAEREVLPAQDIARIIVVPK
jgi:hypothetical protein